MPQRGGVAQLGFGRDIEIAAQRFQRSPHGVDDEIVLVAVLGGVGQRGAIGGIVVGISTARRRSGEGVTVDPVSGAGDQKFGARSQQCRTGEGRARRRQIAQICGRARVGLDQPVQDRQRV